MMNKHFVFKAVTGAWLTLAAVSCPGDVPAARLAGPGGAISQIVYANDRHVAVGQAGLILSSRDGRNWRAENSSTTRTIRGIAHGRGLFVAVGESTILTSRDAIEWVNRDAGFGCLRAIVFAQGIFVGTGASGAIVTSRDGIHWKTRSSGVSGRLDAVVHAEGLFVAGGNCGLLLTSTDGITWNRRELDTRRKIKSIVHETGMFVATDSQDQTFVSADGVDWEKVQRQQSISQASQ